ncbi:OXA-2 [Apiospora phragmitis]|uniref:OXA-2 n=1 Tax=Apiospora phragmitis TaxID=2905665 RepID=A0ABR1WWD6_9PEZI
MSLHLHRHFAQATYSSVLLKRPSSSFLHPHSAFKRLQAAAHLQQPGRQRRTLFTESIQAAAQGSQDLILGVHAATGLPWAAVIPLIAVAVNAIFRLPFSAYSQKLLQRRKRVEPLMQAWRQRVMKDVIIRERTDPTKVQSIVEDRLKTTQKRVYSALGLRQWRFYLNIATFPVWILALDGIRKVCGGQKGVLLGLLTGETSVGAESATGQAAAADASNTAAAVATTTTGGPVAQGISAAVDTSMPEITSAASSVVGPTTTALRPFPDHRRHALVHRPDRGRPAARSALFGQWWRRRPGEEDVTKFNPKLMTRGLYRGIVYAMPFGTFVLLDMPAALHLYWLSSATAHFAFGQVLSWAMPLKQEPVKKCEGVASMIVSPKSKPGQKDWEKLF